MLNKNLMKCRQCLTLPRHTTVKIENRLLLKMRQTFDKTLIWKDLKHLSRKAGSHLVSREETYRLLE